jgi:hypothetical protein
MEFIKPRPAVDLARLGIDDKAPERRGFPLGAWDEKSFPRASPLRLPEGLAERHGVDSALQPPCPDLLARPAISPVSDRAMSCP